MRIALLGTRGIPANYGGFETFAEELSVRLAERGHRSHRLLPFAYHRGRRYRGVELRYLPTIRHKYFDTHCAYRPIYLRSAAAPVRCRALLQRR